MQSYNYQVFPLSLRVHWEYVGLPGELLISISFIDFNANDILLGASSAIGEQTAYLSGASAKRY